MWLHMLHPSKLAYMFCAQCVVVTEASHSVCRFVPDALCTYL